MLYDGVTEQLAEASARQFHLRWDEHSFYGWTKSARDLEDGVINAFVLRTLADGR